MSLVSIVPDYTANQIPSCFDLSLFSWLFVCVAWYRFIYCFIHVWFVLIINDPTVGSWLSMTSQDIPSLKQLGDPPQTQTAFIHFISAWEVSSQEINDWSHLLCWCVWDVCCMMCDDVDVLFDHGDFIFVFVCYDFFMCCLMGPLGPLWPPLGPCGRP